MKNILIKIKKMFAATTLMAFVVSSLGLQSVAVANAAVLPNWNATGSYVVNMNYLGSDYAHDMSLTQDGSGNLTGNGGSPAGANVYTWTVTSGTVAGDTIDFNANYTATADAVTPQTVLHINGTVASDGTMSGTWSDNYQGGDRSGTWATASGSATNIQPPAMVTVTINKFVNGVQATASSSNSLDFPMSATYNAVNTGAGSGTYTLSAAGYNGDPTPYQAKTIPLTSGADYATNEIVGGAVVGTTCSTSSAPFAFVGYSTGNTFAEAVAAPQSTSTPTFTNIISDKYVIVWNNSCATNGTIGGTVTGGPGSGVGTLAVTGITAVKTTAVADGTFASGWKYTFSITIPTNETNLSMKFADWASDVGSNTLPAANNMRISSTQANNAGATVLVTAANTYTIPTLTMTGDLNPLLDGKQVEVSVEVAVPSSTVNGSYTTSYGVKTQ